MGLLAPWLLGGLAFLAVPWIIHRKRKPPRNPTPFSSLMFVPDVAPTSKARKRIENPWLMALRMLLLALLALAYARPFNFAVASLGPETQIATAHVLLVDVSASMLADGQQAARDGALATLLDSIGAEDDVAVVIFDDTQEVRVPFVAAGEAPRDQRALAEKALQDLPEAAGGTDYRGALAKAESLFRGVRQSDDEPVRQVIHLVSDLQRSGMPSDGTSFTLSESTELDIVVLEPELAMNVSVADVALIPEKKEHLLVRARVQNHGAAAVECSGALLIDNDVLEEQALVLPALGSRTVSFRVPVDSTQEHRVAVQVMKSDALTADNQFFAVYRPEKQREIGVVLDGTDAGVAGAARFLAAAVAESQPLPWTLTPLHVEERPDITAWPEVLVVVDSGLDEVSARKIGAYVAQGGRVLLIPGTKGFGAALTSTLLQETGVTGAGRRFEAVSDSQFATFSWLNFESALFQNFRDPAYSDFSMVRFNNFFAFSVEESETTQVLARLEGEQVGREYPGLISAEVASGQVVIWTFPLDPAWSNLTRTRRFVPVLHESIALLLPRLFSGRSWQTGQRATSPVAMDVDEVVLPGESDGNGPDELAPELARLVQSGYLEWAGTDTAGESRVTEAVNLPFRESDGHRFSEEEFRLRLGTTAPAALDDTEGEGQVAQDVVHWEHGYAVLALLLGAYVMEAGLSLWLGQRQRRES